MSGSFGLMGVAFQYQELKSFQGIVKLRSQAPSGPLDDDGA